MEHMFYYKGLDKCMGKEDKGQSNKREAGEELGLHGTKRLPERSDGSSGSAAA